MTDREYNYRDHIGETHYDGTPHVPNPENIQFAYADSEHAVFDIWCLQCGQSGSFGIELTTDNEIQWGE